MKFSIRFLLLLILIAAVFCGGWVAKTNYDSWLTVDPFAHQAVMVDGLVLRTRKNLAAISVGADDGVRQGTLIHVYRDNRLLGTGKVVNLQNNMAAIQMIEETLLRQPQEGDLVIAGK